MRELKRKIDAIAANERAFNVVKTLIAIALALGVTFIVLLLVCDHPVQAFLTMISAPLGKTSYFGRVLKGMVPITFAGLACAMLFRTGLFNLNVEGIYYITGIAATAVATQTGIAGGLHPVLCCLAAGCVGASLMCISGFLKAKFNADVMVTSLMLNSIFLYLGLFILKNTSMRDYGYSNIGSYRFADTAVLPSLFQGMNVTIALPVALVVVVVMHVLLYHTQIGLKIRVAGSNPDFARYSGMGAFGLFMLVHVIAGFLSGVGSTLELLSNFPRFTWTGLPGYGWDGALMAMLGKNDPLSVLVAAFGISWLEFGASQLQYMGVDPEIISIVKAILVLLVSSQYFLKKWKEKALLEGGAIHA